MAIYHALLCCVGRVRERYTRYRAVSATPREVVQNYVIAGSMILLVVLGLVALGVALENHREYYAAKGTHLTRARTAVPIVIAGLILVIVTLEGVFLGGRLVRMRQAQRDAAAQTEAELNSMQDEEEEENEQLEAATRDPRKVMAQAVAEAAEAAEEEEAAAARARAAAMTTKK
jgi:uncharacterized membrane protein